MNFFLLLLLLLPFTSTANSLGNSNKLFDFAEENYPQLFTPVGGSTHGLNNYLVRYYSESNTYIGTKNNEVYVYGVIFNGLLHVGKISDYIKVATDDNELLAGLFTTHKSDVQVQGQGSITVILTDDNHGIRHQRFIIKLATGQSLLIAHNIDLAPKIENLFSGDTIEFFGEYEWNEKGGVIHWTHYDPEKKHVDGWILHNNIVYQRH
jgi:hypothetical protein